jgi:hypothetical protein
MRDQPKLARVLLRNFKARRREDAAEHNNTDI